MAYAIAQTKGAFSSNQNTAVQLDNPTTPGSLLVALVWTNFTSFASSSSITDNKGNTWVLRSTVNGVANGSAYVYTTYNTTGGAGHIITSNLSGSGQDNGIFVREYTGIPSTGFDKVAAQAQNTTTPTSGLTATLTSQPQLVVGFNAVNNSSFASTAGTNFGNLASFSSGQWQVAIEDREVTSTAAVAASFNQATAWNSGTFALTFVSQTPASVSTLAATNVSLTSATANGNVTSDGGNTVTERGFVYSRRVLPAPTVGGTYSTKLTVAGTTGAYSGNITGLQEDTRYQVRAFATTSAGTVYGSQVSLFTETVQNFLMEDGTSKYLLEDGSGYYSMDSTYRMGKQYEADNLTPIYVGTASLNGATNGVWLQYDARNGYDVNAYTSETGTFTPRFEVEAVGTAFGNTPTRVEETVYTNSDEPRGYRTSAFVYDPIRDRFLMFGGANGSTNYNELWELRMNPKGKWRKLNPQGTAPTGRYQGSGVFDQQNNRLLTIFGYDTADTNQVWECSFLNSDDGVWTNRTSGITGNGPSARSNVYQAVANDPANSRCWVFGGWGAAYYNAVYMLDYSTTNMVWSNPGLNGASGAPGIRRSAGCVYDAVGNQLLVWGGAVSGTTFDTALYSFNIGNSTWSTVTGITGGPPVGRELHAMWLEPNVRKMYVYGGWQGAVANMQESLWEYDIASKTWTDRSEVAGYRPLGTYGTSQAYHPDLKVTVLWSGVDTTSDLQHHVLIHDATDNPQTLYGLQMNHAPRPMDAVSVRANRDWSEAILCGGFSQMPDNTTIADGGHVTDIFEYDYAQNMFRVAGAGFKTFQHREGVTVVYDTVRDRYIMFGGLWGNGASSVGCFNDVWEIKKNANQDYAIRRMAPTGTRPGIRWLQAAAFDETLNRMIITCGSNGGTANYNDVWQLDFSGGTEGAWTQLTPTGTAPTAKWGAGYSYDINGRRLFIAGGATSGGEGTYTNQFNMLDMSTTNCAWTTLANVPTAARRTPTLTYDSVNNKCVLFGGWDNTTLYGDLYFYDVTTNTWTADINLTGEPSARRSHGGWYDLENGKIMITHGRPQSGLTWYGDTYALTPNYTTPANSTWENRAPVWWNRASTLARGTTVGVYYFNGTVTNNSAAWTNPNNAADGNTATDATAGGTQAFASGFLQIAGTNAPASGGTISSVKVRSYGGGDTTRGWGEWVQLKTPRAGWSWATLQTLAVRTYSILDANANVVIRSAVGLTSAYNEILGICQPAYYGSGTSTSAHISRIEIEVNTQFANNTAYHWQYWTDIFTPRSFGSNLESDTDFFLGTLAVGGLVKVYIGGAWTGKPKKIYTGSSWTQKKEKIYQGGAWVDA